MHSDLPKDTYYAEMSFNNANEFRDFVLQLYGRSKLMDFIGVGTCQVVFRGVDDASYENTPRAFRDIVDWSQFDFYSPKDFDASKDDRARANFLFDHRQVELRSVFNFLNYSDKLGIATPLNFFDMNVEMSNALDVEKGKSIEFSKRAPRLDYPFPGEQVREAFALAQHYGVPTRLLDWTESPRVAMFFAASKPWKELLGLSSKEAYAGTEKSVSVYGLGTSLAGKLNLDIVQATRYQNARLKSQAGLFILDPHADLYFQEKGSWPSIEDRVRCLEESETSSQIRFLSPGARLLKFSLVASECNKLAELLIDDGVSLETMLPSLDNAALAFAYRRKVVPSGP